MLNKTKQYTTPLKDSAFQSKNASDVTQAPPCFNGISAQKLSKAPPIKKHPLCGKKQLRHDKSTYSLDLPSKSS